MARKTKPLGKPPSRRPGHRSHDAATLAESDPNDRRLIAVHEAGHAVAAVVLGLPLRSVDLRRRKLPDGWTSLGFTDCPIHSTARDAESLRPGMVQGLAGPMAEQRMSPEGADAGAYDSDMESVRRLAAIALCEASPGAEEGQSVITPEEILRNRRRIDDLCVSALREADALVEKHWDAIRETARLLLDRKSLDAAEVRRVVARFANARVG